MLAGLVAAADEAGIPLLVGYSRRFHPQIRLAADLLAAGRLGQPVTVQMTSWFPRPSSYFDDIDWRSVQGHGPLLYELIEEFDALVCLFGSVDDIAGMGHRHESVQGFDDSAVIIIRFQSGVIATLNLSDRVVGPYSWALTSEDDEAFSKTGQNCLSIGGTQGSLSLPHGDFWFYPDGPAWDAKLEHERLVPSTVNARQAQLRHFEDVALRKVAPDVSGADALDLLACVERIYHRIDD